MSAPVRVGVIGVGAISQIAHLPVLATRDDVEIVGICDNDGPKARALADRFDVRNVFEDIEDLLRHGRPDAVVVTTPNLLHEVHAATALSAGAAVLCERPLAMTSAGVEKVLAAQQATGQPLMVGMNHRYRHDVQAIRAFAAGGELGALRGIRTGWYQFRASRAELGWRRRRATSGGGAMLDLGLSLLDLALWVADRPIPKQVSAALSVSSGAEVEDAGCALVHCDGGYSIFVDVAWRYIGGSERFWVDLQGAQGTARINPLKVFKEMHGTPMDVTPTGAASREGQFQTSYRAEWATFLAVARGEVDAPPLDDQIVLHRTLDAIYRSADEGHAVTV